MSCRLETWLELVVGWLLLGSIVLGIVGTIAAFLDITIYSVLAFLLGVIGIAAFLNSSWLKRRKRCKHGVWAGSRGRCRNCQAEAVHLKERREADRLKREQQEAIKEDAKRLREQEVERLSKAWLSNTQMYFEMDPREFENAIAELFRTLGYDVKQTPFSNDGGKDAIAQKGGQKFLIECKRYGATKTVGRRDMQIFVAAMRDETADGGFYITTGSFAKTATKYAAKNGVDTYDRVRLPLLVNQAYPVPLDISKARLLCLECGSVVSLPVTDAPVPGTCDNGHSVISNVTKGDLRMVSSTDTPYCDCGAPMRIVKGYRGRFWGCTRYPRCKHRRPFRPVF